jgi:excisionase family DNA binding protein
LTLQQAAEEVIAHPATLRRAILARKLRAARLGGVRYGAIRIRRSWLREWLERNAEPLEIAPPDPPARRRR